VTDTDLVELVAAFRAGILGTRSSERMCAVVCWPLAGYLGFLGLHVTCEETQYRFTNHIWIQLPDGRVLDPTADQFDPTLGPVYLGKKLAMHRRKGKSAVVST
jgi:hypothetical protein